MEKFYAVKVNNVIRLKTFNTCAHEKRIYWAEFTIILIVINQLQIAFGGYLILISESFRRR